MYKVTKPTLLLDKKKAIQNIKRMAQKASVSDVAYRPHFKTHFSREIGEWYREQGVSSITVSSIDMAVYFAGQGWNDITIAFPVNVLQLNVIKHLAKQITLGLVVESTESAERINQKIADAVNVYVKIDTGYHRTGIWFEDVNQVKDVIDSISDTHTFKGLLAHFGHTYLQKGKNEILSIYEYGVDALNTLKKGLNQNLMISIGDTPSCSSVEKFENIDEIRPGNLAFFDVMQAEIGSCKYEDIAVCLAAPVVAVHNERSEVVVHAGAVHLSKDHLIDQHGKPYFGCVVSLANDGWSAPLGGYTVSSLSQEHGKIKVPKAQLEQIQIGDLLGILPIHSCLTANLMKEYMTLRGERISTMHQ